VRLRTLTEAECYARIYGGRREESVALVWIEPHESERAPEPAEAQRAEAERREAA
jgi:hypothetical protein